MFDRLTFVASPRTEHVTRTVHEHRAPTDQSVALLSEMQEKAQRSVEQSIRLEGNAFKAVIHIIRELYDDRTRAVAHYEANGRQLKSDVWVNGFDASPVNLIEKLVEDCARKLAREILSRPLTEALKRAGGER